MGFFKKLFSGEEPSAEEREQKRQENDFDVLKYDGIHALRIGRLTYAIACFTHALDIQEDQETREHLAMAYIRNDDLESAREEFGRLSELHPDDLNYPTNKANLLYELEEYEESREICTDLLERDSSLAFPSYILGLIAKAEDKLDDADENLSFAISKREGFIDAILARSEVRYSKGDYADAMKDIDYLIENEHGSDEVLLQKGLILEAMGETEEAIIYYNNVLSNNPFFISAFGNLASLLIKEGKYDKASEVIEEGLEHNDESSLLIGIRAELKSAMGDSAGAEADRKYAEELKAAEEERENEDYDVEREMLERQKAINPLI